MKASDIIISEDAERDLNSGQAFYSVNDESTGDYFIDTVLSRIEKLRILAGTHSKQYGYHRMLCDPFPFGIYYQMKDDIAMVIAVLDMRADPRKIKRTLKRRD